MSVTYLTNEAPKMADPYMYINREEELNMADPYMYLNQENMDQEGEDTDDDECLYVTDLNFTTAHACFRSNSYSVLGNDKEIQYAAKGRKAGTVVSNTKIEKTSYFLPKELPPPLSTAGAFGDICLVESKKAGRQLIVKVLKPGKLADSKTKKKDIMAKLKKLEAKRNGGKKKLNNEELMRELTLQDELEKTKQRIATETAKRTVELQSEMRALQALNHKNVVKFYGYDDEAGPGNLRIVTEYLPGLKTLGENGFVPNIKKIALCAANGLDAMHKTGLLHNDLAPRNIFITSKTMALIGDFGLAKAYNENGFAARRQHDRVPIDIKAPEHDATGNMDRYFSIKTDVYAFGLFLCSLLYNDGDRGFVYFAGETLESREMCQVAKCTEGALLEKMLAAAKPKKKLSPKLKKIINKCLTPMPSARPLMPEVIKDLKELTT